MKRVNEQSTCKKLLTASILIDFMGFLLVLISIFGILYGLSFLIRKGEILMIFGGIFAFFSWLGTHRGWCCGQNYLRHGDEY